MLFNPFKAPVVPVKPEPERAAELQRRFDALQYRPETGFHRDRIQTRKDVSNGR